MPKRRVRRHSVVQPLGKPYRLIPLTQGQNAIVDIKDFERIAESNWHARWIPANRTFYATRDVRQVGQQIHIQMHCEVLELPQGTEVDHRNHNGLDNRKINLRACTHAQNLSNGKKRRNNTSGFKGVSLDKAKLKWAAYIWRKGKKIHLGMFTSPEEAARAYDRAAERLHGEFASLNFEV